MRVVLEFFYFFYFLEAFSFKYLSGRRNTFLACTHAGCFKMHLEAYSFLVTFFSPLTITNRGLLAGVCLAF